MNDFCQAWSWDGPQVRRLIFYQMRKSAIFGWSNSYKRRGPPQEIAHMFYMHAQEEVQNWDPTMIREAAALLASFSLIKFDETVYCMSMRPLVHVWARDRLSKTAGVFLGHNQLHSSCRHILGTHVGNSCWLTTAFDDLYCLISDLA